MKTNEQTILQLILDCQRRQELFLAQIASALTHEEVIAEKRIQERAVLKEDVRNLIADIRKSQKKLK